MVTEPGAPCLEQAAFERALFARITRPRGEGRAGETKVQVGVEPESGGGFAGRVTVIEPDGEPRERTLHGASCDHVVLSLVLVAALALGGPAERTGEPAPSRESADDAADERRSAPEVAPPAVTPWSAIVGGHGSLAAAGAGEPALGGDVFGELASKRTGFAPGLRVALAYAAAQRSAGALTMRITTLTARLEPALVRLELGRITTRLLLALEGGAALADAAGAPRVDGAVRPWLRGGALGEIATDIAGPVGLELAGGALVALVRDSFVVEPTDFGVRVPLVSAVGRVGIYVRIR